LEITGYNGGTGNTGAQYYVGGGGVGFNANGGLVMMVVLVLVELE
jgi:hypothetical protein